MFDDLPQWLHDWYFTDVGLYKFSQYDYELYYTMCQVGEPCIVCR